MPISCDQCDTYHRLGYDRCPACQYTPDEALPAATPLALLLSLEDAMRQCQLEGGHVDKIQLTVWIALVQTTRHRLEAPATEDAL